MPTPFSRTARSLNADTYRRSTFALLITVALLGAWIAWLFAARVAIYETTDQARLEVDNAVHPIESPIFGRVVATNLIMGREVQAGDVLVELDAQAQRLQLNEEESQVTALSSQLDVLRGEATTQNRSLNQTREGTPLALAEAQARQQEAETAARQAAEEARRMARLHKDGLISELILLRAQAEAEKTRWVADALQLAVRRLGKDQETKETDRQVGIEVLKRQAANMEGEITTKKATIERLKYEIARRVIRAAAAGRLGEVGELKAGSVVHEGQKLGAIVPSGTLRVVAEFIPSVALGRIHPGQAARVRLEGFPWTEYGGISATVANVASEPREGRVRVEMLVHADPASAIPLQHGLPGTVEVEVERASPAVLLLRAAGRRLTGVAQQRQSASREGS
jgi:multidrug resistance efflux pump